MTDIVEEAMRVIALTEGLEIHRVRSRLRDLPGNPRAAGPERRSRAGGGPVRRAVKGGADRLVRGTMAAVSPAGLLRTLEGYGSEECGRISRFLTHACGSYLSRADYAWISATLEACLRRYDDGADGKSPEKLRVLRDQVGYLLSLADVL